MSYNLKTLVYTSAVPPAPVVVVIVVVVVVVVVVVALINLSSSSFLLPVMREKIYTSARAHKRLKTTHPECNGPALIDRFEEYLATSYREPTL